MINPIRIFISQPLAEKSEEEIHEQREEAEELIKQLLGEEEDILFLDAWITDKPREFANKPLWYLAQSIESLAHADLAYFCDGWEDARGCRIEYECASNYGIPISTTKTVKRALESKDKSFFNTPKRDKYDLCNGCYDEILKRL